MTVERETHWFRTKKTQIKQENELANSKAEVPTSSNCICSHLRARLIWKMQRVDDLNRQTHKRPNFKWDDRSVYPNLRARAKWGDQGRCLPNMGRVSPGDEVAGGTGRSGWREVIWRGERYVLMLAARFIDFPRRSARTTPFIIYIFRARWWLVVDSCYFRLARPPRGNMIDWSLPRAKATFIVVFAISVRRRSENFYIVH